MNKKQKIAFHFRQIMHELGLDLEDPSLVNTPDRVAKMYCDELFYSLNQQPPKLMFQPNTFKYDQMIIQKGIEINSICEHHFVPILAKCAIGYIPNKKLIGLSKLNRIAKYYGGRPQVQERLTGQIKDYLIDNLETEDVAVVVDGIHLCVKMRGVKDSNCSMRTSSLSGIFRDNGQARNEFLKGL